MQSLGYDHIDDLPHNVCTTCLRNDYVKWGKELIPKDYKGESFDLQSVPPGLLKYVFSKMNQSAFTRMRRSTKFYSQFIEKHRKIMKICMFHNRSIEISVESDETIAFYVNNAGFPLHHPFNRFARSVLFDWDAIEEMSERDVQEWNRRIEEVNLLPPPYYPFSTTTTIPFQNHASGINTQAILENEEMEVIFHNIRHKYFLITNKDLQQTLKELTGHWKPLALHVTCFLAKHNAEVDLLCEVLKAIKPADKSIKFTRVSDYGLQKISEVMDPTALDIHLHRMSVIQHTLVRVDPRRPRTLHSYYPFQNLTTLILNSAECLLATLPPNLMGQLEVVSLNTGEEWTTLAANLLRMWKAGHSRLKDLYIGEMEKRERQQFIDIFNRPVVGEQLRPYFSQYPAVEEFALVYRTRLYLLQNQQTGEVGIAHLRSILRFIKPARSNGT